MISNVCLERLWEDMLTHFKHQKSVGESSDVKKFRIRIIPSMASGVAGVTPESRSSQGSSRLQSSDIHW